MAYYIKLLSKYQEAVLGSCRENCNEKSKDRPTDGHNDGNVPPASKQS